MKMSSLSFVEVRQVTAGYTAEKKGWKRLWGSRPVTPAVRQITLHLDQGRHYVLYGPEGAGKTTLLRVLAGTVKPLAGHVLINKKAPQPNGSSATLVTSEQYTATAYSTSEYLREQVARAANSETAVILLDDVADELGPATVKEFLATVFKGRTVMVATRHSTTAEALALPLFVLQRGRLISAGTSEHLARNAAIPRAIDIWLEGVHYEVIHTLRKHPGIIEARLLPNPDFRGQRLRLTIRSSHYLPAVYDTISRLPLLKVEELPPVLSEVIDLIAQVSANAD